MDKCLLCSALPNNLLHTLTVYSRENHPEIPQVCLIILLLYVVLAVCRSRELIGLNDECLLCSDPLLRCEEVDGHAVALVGAGSNFGQPEKQRSMKTNCIMMSILFPSSCSVN